MPSRSISEILPFDYAHRGLWGPTAPENTLPAFEAAVQAGYGIELDVQLTKDHEVAVFHDNDLYRCCGIHADIHQITLQDAQQYKVCGSSQSIPSLSDVLQCIDGQVPVILEIKTCRDIYLLCQKTADLLEKYHGAFCIESFNPMAVRWFRIHRPGWIRGQLVFSIYGKKYAKKPAYFLLASLLQNVLGRPDFLACDVEADRGISISIVKHLFHPWTMGWTVRSQQDYARCSGQFDLIIFESFLPEKSVSSAKCVE